MKIKGLWDTRCTRDPIALCATVEALHIAAESLLFESANIL